MANYHSLCFDSFTAYLFFPKLTFSIALNFHLSLVWFNHPLVKLSNKLLLTTVPFATENNFPFTAIKLPDFPSQMPPKTLIPTNTPFKLMPMKSKLDNNEAAGILKQWQVSPHSPGPLLSHLILKPWAALCFHSTQQDGNPALGGGITAPLCCSPPIYHRLNCTCSLCCRLPGTYWDAGISKLQPGKADSHCYKHSLRNSPGCCRKSWEKNYFKTFCLHLGFNFTGLRGCLL